MFFQEAPAETMGYMILGFSVIFGTMLIYLFSLYNRWRNVIKDEELITELNNAD